MGRAKLSMELIEKEQSRWTTFQKRKKCLKRKASEFSTLCGVDTCMIIYGPVLSSGQARTVETWPEDPQEVSRVVEAYKAFDSRGVKKFGLVDYFLRRKKKVDDEVAKLKKSNMEAKYPTWNRHLDNLSLDQIGRFISVIDNVLDHVRCRMAIMLEDRKNVFNRAHNGFEVHQIPPSYIPDSINLPMVAFNKTHLMNSMTMWTANGCDFPVSSENVRLHGSSYKFPACYEDVTSCAGFGGPPGQQLVPCGDFQFVPAGDSIHFHGFCLDDTCQDIGRQSTINLNDQF